MKKIILAIVLAATAASAQAAVTFGFTGAEFEGATVSGTLTIDTDALIGANTGNPPATTYYFATGDAASSSVLPFLSVSFSSTGSNPTLLAMGDVTYQWLQGDPADGSLALELDYQRDNGDGTLSSSTFTLSGFDLLSSQAYGGALLPDFANAGTVFFVARSGTGERETYDVVSSGALTFSAPVPETSSWAMLVIGFGAVGYAARRRAHVIAAA